MQLIKKKSYSKKKKGQKKSEPELKKYNFFFSMFYGHSFVIDYSKKKMFVVVPFLGKTKSQ